MSMQEELHRLQFLVSDQSLLLLPEYHQRITVRIAGFRLRLIIKRAKKKMHPYFQQQNFDFDTKSTEAT